MGEGPRMHSGVQAIPGLASATASFRSMREGGKQTPPGHWQWLLMPRCLGRAAGKHMCWPAGRRGPPCVTLDCLGATFYTCCLNARLSRAWEAHLQVSFSGMTSAGRALDLIMKRRCCLQLLLRIVPRLWLPRLVLSRSSSTLPHELAMSGSCRGILAWCVVCGMHTAAPAPVLHMSAPVRRGAVADARLGLWCRCCDVRPFPPLLS